MAQQIATELGLINPSSKNQGFKIRKELVAL
jgi:hypothetical protein